MFAASAIRSDVNSINTKAYFNEIYERYSATKSVSERQDGIVSSMFYKMCKEAGILNDSTFRKQDADLLFTRMKPPNHIKIDKSIFRDCLRIIADKLGITYSYLLEQIACVTRPSDAPLPQGSRLYEDKTKYTGVFAGKHGGPPTVHDGKESLGLGGLVDRSRNAMSGPGRHLLTFAGHPASDTNGKLLTRGSTLSVADLDAVFVGVQATDHNHMYMDDPKYYENADIGAKQQHPNLARQEGRVHNPLIYPSSRSTLPSPAVEPARVSHVFNGTQYFDEYDVSNVARIPYPFSHPGAKYVDNTVNRFEQPRHNELTPDCQYDREPVPSHAPRPSKQHVIGGNLISLSELGAAINRRASLTGHSESNDTGVSLHVAPVQLATPSSVSHESAPVSSQNVSLPSPAVAELELIPATKTTTTGRRASVIINGQEYFIQEKHSSQPKPPPPKPKSTYSELASSAISVGSTANDEPVAESKSGRTDEVDTNTERLNKVAALRARFEHSKLSPTMSALSVVPLVRNVAVPNTAAAVTGSISKKWEPKRIVQAGNYLDTVDPPQQTAASFNTTVPPFLSLESPPHVLQNIPLYWRANASELNTLHAASYHSPAAWLGMQGNYPVHSNQYQFLNTNPTSNVREPALYPTTVYRSLPAEVQQSELFRLQQQNEAYERFLATEPSDDGVKEKYSVADPVAVAPQQISADGEPQISVDEKVTTTTCNSFRNPLHYRTSGNENFRLHETLKSCKVTKQDLHGTVISPWVTTDVSSSMPTLPTTQTQTNAENAVVGTVDFGIDFDLHSPREILNKVDLMDDHERDDLLECLFLACSNGDWVCSGDGIWRLMLPDMTDYSSAQFFSLLSDADPSPGIKCYRRIISLLLSLEEYISTPNNQRRLQTIQSVMDFGWKGDGKWLQGTKQLTGFMSLQACIQLFRSVGLLSVTNKGNLGPTGLNRRGPFQLLTEFDVARIYAQALHSSGVHSSSPRQSRPHRGARVIHRTITFNQFRTHVISSVSTACGISANKLIWKILLSGICGLNASELGWEDEDNCSDDDSSNETNGYSEDDDEDKSTASYVSGADAGKTSSRDSAVFAEKNVAVGLQLSVLQPMTTDNSCPVNGQQHHQIDDYCDDRVVYDDQHLISSTVIDANVSADASARTSQSEVAPFSVKPTIPELGSEQGLVDTSSLFSHGTVVDPSSDVSISLLPAAQAAPAAYGPNESQRMNHFETTESVKWPESIIAPLSAQSPLSESPVAESTGALTPSASIDGVPAPALTASAAFECPISEGPDAKLTLFVADFAGEHSGFDKKLSPNVTAPTVSTVNPLIALKSIKPDSQTKMIEAISYSDEDGDDDVDDADDIDESDDDDGEDGGSMDSKLHPSTVPSKTLNTNSAGSSDDEESPQLLIEPDSHSVNPFRITSLSDSFIAKVIPAGSSNAHGSASEPTLHDSKLPQKASSSANFISEHSETPIENLESSMLQKGFLMKLATESQRNWKTRYFTLNTYALCYYDDGVASGTHFKGGVHCLQGKKGEKKGEVAITGDTTVTVLDHVDGPDAPQSMLFELHDRDNDRQDKRTGRPYFFRVRTPMATIVLCASGDDMRNEWIKAFKLAISVHAKNSVRGYAPVEVTETVLLDSTYPMSVMKGIGGSNNKEAVHKSFQWRYIIVTEKFITVHPSCCQCSKIEMLVRATTDMAFCIDPLPSTGRQRNDVEVILEDASRLRWRDRRYKIVMRLIDGGDCYPQNALMATTATGSGPSAEFSRNMHICVMAWLQCLCRSAEHVEIVSEYSTRQTLLQAPLHDSGVLAGTPFTASDTKDLHTKDLSPVAGVELESNRPPVDTDQEPLNALQISKQRQQNRGSRSQTERSAHRACQAPSTNSDSVEATRTSKQPPKYEVAKRSNGVDKDCVPMHIHGQSDPSRPLEDKINSCFDLLTELEELEHRPYRESAYVSESRMQRAPPSDAKDPDIPGSPDRVSGDSSPSDRLSNASGSAASELSELSMSFTSPAPAPANIARPLEDSPKPKHLNPLSMFTKLVHRLRKPPMPSPVWVDEATEGPKTKPVREIIPPGAKKQENEKALLPKRTATEGKSQTTASASLTSTAALTQENSLAESIVDTDDKWEEKYNAGLGRKYWKNIATGKTTWKNPVSATEIGVSATDVSKTRIKSLEHEDVSTDIQSDHSSTSNIATSTPCSGEWEAKYHKKLNKPYWKHVPTGRTSWKEPHHGAAQGPPAEPAVASDNNSDKYSTSFVALTTDAPDWEERYSSKYKKTYWRNKESGETTWKLPLNSSKTPNAGENALDEPKDKRLSSVIANGAASSSDASTLKVQDGNDQRAWMECFSEKHNRPYWKHNVTYAISWKNPGLESKGGNIPASDSQDRAGNVNLSKLKTKVNASTSRVGEATTLGGDTEIYKGVLDAAMMAGSQNNALTFVPPVNHVFISSYMEDDDISDVSNISGNMEATSEKCTRNENLSTKIQDATDLGNDSKERMLVATTAVNAMLMRPNPLLQKVASKDSGTPRFNSEETKNANLSRAAAPSRRGRSTRVSFVDSGDV
jgi:hypothetical protein